MNTPISNLFKAISNNAKEEGTAMHTDTSIIESNHPKAFTVADLWNIQRQKKTLVRRRYFAD